MASRFSCLPALTFFAAFFAASPALAQEPANAPAEYAPCSKAPTDADRAAAKGLHEAAKQYFAKALYDEAIAKWVEAYGFDCTKYQLFINIGNAYEKLPGQTAKAIGAFETYVQRAGKDADPEIVEKVKNLKQLLAREKAQAAVDAIAKAAPPPADDHRIEAPPPAPSPPTKSGAPWPWVVVGSGGGLVLVGAVLLGAGAAKVSSSAKDCTNPQTHSGCSPDAQSGGNTGLAMQDAGGALLGIGIAAAAGGVIWWAVTRPKPAAAPKASWHIAPALAPGNYGLSAALRF